MLIPALRITALSMAVALVTATCSMMAQDPETSGPSSTITKFSYADGIFFTTYLDGSVTALNVESLFSGPVQVSNYAGSSDTDGVRQDPYGDTAKLTTSWCDKKGVTHTVSTPIASTTKAGLARAKATHQALVAMMQKLYPPKDV